MRHPRYEGQIKFIGKVPSNKMLSEAFQICDIVNRLVFGGTINRHVECVEIYKRRDIPPGHKEETWLYDGLRGMYDPKTKTARICLKSFYGSMLWGVAHDLTHVHDLVTGNLAFNADGSVQWLGERYAAKKAWEPYVTRATRKNYKEFGGIFKPVIDAADEHVPWEVKPSVMAEVALMELRGLNGKYRKNRSFDEPG